MPFDISLGFRVLGQPFRKLFHIKYVVVWVGVLKLDGSGLPEVRLIYTYGKLRAPSLTKYVVEF
jgi:hypothetical protein